MTGGEQHAYTQRCVESGWFNVTVVNGERKTFARFGNCLYFALQIQECKTNAATKRNAHGTCAHEFPGHAQMLKMSNARMANANYSKCANVKWQMLKCTNAKCSIPLDIPCSTRAPLCRWKARIGRRRCRRQSQTGCQRALRCQTSHLGPAQTLE